MKKRICFIGLLSSSFFYSYSQEAAKASDVKEVKSTFADNVEAIGSLAWPAIVIVIFILLYPQIKNIVRSRSFSIKVAGMELNVQNMADQLSEQIHELQNKIIALECQVQENAGGMQLAPLATSEMKKKWRILWVTGKHENHAFEINYLEKDGVEVIKAHSTDDAMKILHVQAQLLDAVVTGVSRRENEVVNEQAGLELLQRVKAAQIKTPVFVMCSDKSIENYYSLLKEEGAIEATSSSLDLLAFLKGAGINCSRQLKANGAKVNAGFTTSVLEGAS